MEQISKELEKLQQNIPNQKSYSNLGETEEIEIVKGSPEWVTQRLKLLGISSLSHTFETFEAKTKELVKVTEIMKSISEGKTTNKQFILLYGTTGCGKTHLIEATIVNWAKNKTAVYYRTFSDIARQLKTELRKGGDWYDDAFKRLCDNQILIVDDYGMGTTESRFEISDLEDIIDTRYRKRYYPNLKLITILATNKDIKELPDRVTSRFYDPEFGIVLYMGDRDYRRRQVK